MDKIKIGSTVALTLRNLSKYSYIEKQYVSYKQKISLSSNNTLYGRIVDVLMLKTDIGKITRSIPVYKIQIKDEILYLSDFPVLESNRNPENFRYLSTDLVEMRKI